MILNVKTNELNNVTELCNYWVLLCFSPQIIWNQSCELINENNLQLGITHGFYLPEKSTVFHASDV